MFAVNRCRKIIIMERRISKIEDSIDTHGRLSALETKSDTLKESIDTIMTNHLPHLQEAIDEGRRENNDNIEKLRLESKQNLDGLGSRFERSLESVTKSINDNHKESCATTDRKLDRIGNQFWAVIILLLSAVISIATLQFK